MLQGGISAGHRNLTRNHVLTKRLVGFTHIPAVKAIDLEALDAGHDLDELC
jgi:hypothetical protein